MNLTYVAWSVFIPIGVASGAVALALTCWRHPMTHAVIIPDDGLGGRGTAHTTERLASDMDTRRQLFVAIAIALGVVLMASVFLWALTHPEYFMDVLGPLVRWLEGIGVNAVMIVFVTVTLLSQIPRVALSLTWITPWRGVAIGLVCVGVLMSWVFVDSWITLNLMAALFSVVLAVTLQPRISFLRLCVILLVFAVLYDAWQVYGTSNMANLAQAMVPVVGAPQRVLSLPMLYVLPYDVSFAPQAYGILGTGDVVVLCLMAIAAARFGRRMESPVPLLGTFVGFAAAMVLCSAVMSYFNAGQPATIYIVPLCALPVMAYAKLRDSFDQLGVPFYGPRNKDERVNSGHDL